MVPWEGAPPAPVDTLPPAPAAGPDTVRTKDGSVTSGTIVVERPGLYVSVRVADGRDVLIQWGDIEKIERGVTPPPAAPPPKVKPTAPPVVITPAAPPLRVIPLAPLPNVTPSARPANDAMPEVHIEGPGELTLEQLDDRQWSEVCHAPCDRRLSRDARYRITGDSIRKSRIFSLESHGGRALLKVTPASSSSRGGGLGLVIVGAIVTPVGLLVGLSSANGSTSTGYVGIGLATAGLVCLVAGGVLLGGAPETEVRQPPANPTSARSPTWNASLERAPSSGISFALPVFSGTF